jgi:hypothetical protein
MKIHLLSCWHKVRPLLTNAPKQRKIVGRFFERKVLQARVLRSVSPGACQRREEYQTMSVHKVLRHCDRFCNTKRSGLLSSLARLKGH